MEAITIINAAPNTKVQIKNFVQKVKNIILNGEENPLKFQVQLKAMEDIIKFLRTDKDIKEYTLEEAEKYGQKTFDEFGANITIKEVGIKYDYSSCNDSEWAELNIKINNLTELRKNREELLKNLKPEMKLADAKTGELLLMPLKTSTTGVTITLK